MNKFILRLKEDSKFLLIMMMVLAVIVLALFFFWAGLVALFFIGLVIWIVYVFFYLRVLFKISFSFRIVVYLVLLFVTFGLLYKAVPEKFHFGGSKVKVKNGVVVNGITLVPCSRTLADKPTKLAGLDTDLYSAPLTKNSADPEQANNVRTFSLKGLTDKTEANSFFAHFDMSDNSTIQGYDDGMEVCNSDNKTNVSYNTASNDSSDIVTESNVTARTHYFHGGKYIAEPGIYRVDQFVRDKADGKWKLVNRVEGITITE